MGGTGTGTVLGWVRARWTEVLEPVVRSATVEQEAAFARREEQGTFDVEITGGVELVLEGGDGLQDGACGKREGEADLFVVWHEWDSLCASCVHGVRVSW